MVTPIELPDWVRGTLLLGSGPAGVIVPILVDAAGQINVLTRGVDALGTVRTVRVDNAGQLYAILRGAGGNDVAVDAVGNLAAILKGIDGLGNLHTVFVDASGQIVMVPRGSTGNYLAIDASGFMTAVLKGEYAGLLHTIAVDASGRIEAFLMDGADQWGQSLRIGNAELGSRINPTRTYDWRGSSLYSCDFSQGRPSGTITLSGLGAAVALDPVYWRVGGYSLKLTGGSTVNKSAALNIARAAPPTAKIGLQAEFSVEANLVYFYVTTIYDYGVNRRQFGLAVDVALKKLKYLDSTGAYVAFKDVWFDSDPTIFHILKVVMDASTGKYVRCLFNREEVDMSALDCQTLASLDSPYANVSFVAVSAPAANLSAWLDSFVITTNEP